jgi:hypothetical protein
MNPPASKSGVAPATTRPEQSRDPASAGVVILRETECGDLSAAIRRVRSDAATARSRIVVIAAEDPVPSASEFEPGGPPLSPARLGRRLGAAALAETGTRLVRLLDCLEHLEGETALALADLDDAIGDHSRARLRRGIGVVQDIRAWSAEVLRDLRQEVAAAAAGRCSIDPIGLLVEAARSIEDRFPTLQVHIEPGQEDAVCLARPTDLEDAFFFALLLLACRLGGTGTVNATVERKEDVLRCALQGIGSTRPIDLPETVERFRAVVAAIGGRIVPVPDGVQAPGLVLELPLAP